MKLLALFAIVVSHSVPRYGAVGTPGLIAFDVANPWRQFPVLLGQYYCGQLGNAVFIAASAFFLVDNDTVKTGKIWRIVLDSLFFSLLYLLLFSLLGLRLPTAFVIQQFFPITHNFNWFIACYLILYAVHPACNWVIRRLSRRQLLGAVLIGGVLYSLVPTLFGPWYHYTQLVGFFLLYLIVAYMKLYMPRFRADARKNGAVLLLSLALLSVSIWWLNARGLRDPAHANETLQFCQFVNPLMILAALTTLNLFSSLSLPRSRVINTLSSLSLLVYLIHENVLFREYGKSAFWAWVYEVHGYRFAALWVLLFAAICYFGSLAIGYLYRRSAGRAVTRLAEFADKHSRRLFTSLLDRLTT